MNTNLENLTSIFVRLGLVIVAVLVGRYFFAKHQGDLYAAALSRTAGVYMVILLTVLTAISSLYSQ